MIEKFKKLDSEVIHSNPYWDYNIDRYVMPNGISAEYYYVRSNGSTFIIPITDDDKIILVRQFRYLNQQISLEFPGGGLKSGISIEKNAQEELQQETGFFASNLELIGKYNPCNGMTNELCHVFVGYNLNQSKIEADESEEIEVLYFSKSEIINLIKSDEIWDGMTLAAWSLFCNSQFYDRIK